MAFLKKIKFGESTNNIAKTIVNGAPEGVIAVTNTSTYENTDSEDKDYSYDIDVNVDNATIVKSSGSLAVGTVPAAKVSVAEGAGIEATTAQAAFKELKDKIDDVDGAAKSYKIVEVAEPASTSQAEYKIQEKSANGEWGDVTGSSPIVVPKDNAFVTARLGHTGATVDQETGAITDGAATGAEVLLIEYKNGEGVYTLVEIPVGDFLRESEFKDGLQVNEGEVSVKIDSTSETFLTVSNKGVKLSGVQDAINNAVDALDVTDTAAAGQYVSAVNETNGKVSMTRANVSDAVLNGYAKGTKPASTAIAATDDVKGAIAKLEHQIDDAKAAATTKVEKEANASHLTLTNESAADGSVTYTIGESDIASKTDLDAEIAARKAVDGQNGQTYAANTTANYINNATSLNDADVKLDTAIKAEETRAKAAEDEIANKVGLTGAEGSRTFTPTTNYGGTDTSAATSVMGNMQKIDTALKAVSDKANAIQYKVNGTTLEFYGMTEKTGA